jgi:hypothetical protein
MKRIFFLLLIIFTFWACNSDDQTSLTQDNHLDTLNPKIFFIDEYARFISGIHTDSFADLQYKNFYKNYAESIETTWNYFYINQLLVITNWAKENSIISDEDANTVFYPFSGPDYSFVSAFYPYAKNYLFIGLENIGSVPDFKNYTDLEIEQYINSLSNALKDFFSVGYFSTEKMKHNFRDPEMNGIVHPLLFFITRTGNKIENLEYFVINQFGKIQVVDTLNPADTLIKGIKFSFSGDYGNKNLYYIQVDLSNDNFPQHPELLTFISNFNEKNVFLKSSSYLLQQDNFSIFRDFLIKQAAKILQDDSGFGYEFLLNSGFNVKLFGNYYHTLNIFKEFSQPKLQKAYETQNPKNLPFRFGYNIPFDETAIIYATKNQIVTQHYPVYRIQFKISWNKLKINEFPETLQPVNYFFDEGYYKYTTGNFDNLNDAKAKLYQIKSEYPDAFIIEINKNSKRIIED